MVDADVLLLLLCVRAECGIAEHIAEERRQVKGSVKLVQKDSAAAEDDAPTRGAISEPRRTPVPPTPPAPASPEGLRRRARRQGHFGAGAG